MSEGPLWLYTMQSVISLQRLEEFNTHTTAQDINMFYSFIIQSDLCGCHREICPFLSQIMFLLFSHLFL